MIYLEHFQSPMGTLSIACHDNQLVLCDWQKRKMRDLIDQRITKALHDNFTERSHPLIEETKRQMNDYFNGQLKVFSLPLKPIGTDFQRKIWNQLLHIPFGKTKSYLELSHTINQPEAIRAVAGANRANALSIIVPCHRVIGSDGKLTGYAGGLATKKKLLTIEGINFPPHQTSLFDADDFE